MWAMPTWFDFVVTVPHLCTQVDQCMFGHASFRGSLFIQQVAAFHPLELRCDPSHLHHPPGTSSLAYPWPLARALTHDVQKQWLGWDLKLPADRLEFLADMIQACRAYVGVQVRKKLPHWCLSFNLLPRREALFPSFAAVSFNLAADCLLACLCLPAASAIPGWNAFLPDLRSCVLSFTGG